MATMVGRPLLAHDFYSFYWFGDEGVIVARVVSLPLFLVVACVAAALIFLATGLFDIVTAAIATGTSFLIMVLQSSRARAAYSILAPEELTRRRAVKSFSWSEIRSTKIDGRRFRFSAGGNHFRVPIRGDDAKELTKLLASTATLRPSDMDSTSTRVKGLPVAVVRTLQVSAFVGAILYSIGFVYAVGFFSYSPWQYILSLGEAMFLDSGTVYALLRPKTMAPIPAVVGYIALLILNTGVLLWLAFPQSFLIFEYQMLGVVLTLMVGGLSFRRVTFDEAFEDEG